LKKAHISKEILKVAEKGANAKSTKIRKQSHLQGGPPWKREDEPASPSLERDETRRQDFGRDPGGGKLVAQREISVIREREMDCEE